MRGSGMIKMVFLILILIVIVILIVILILIVIVILIVILILIVIVIVIVIVIGIAPRFLSRVEGTCRMTESLSLYLGATFERENLRMFLNLREDTY